ncbi:MAG: hypothetical protein J7M18_02955 [Candidatus Eremiobacteraeota bacterium]|nr:hypothetical protein [Candidatus Eremiobacteraeota bacterium]
MTRVYRGGITREFIILGGLNLIISFALIYYGLKYKEDFCWFGLSFICMGILLTGILALIFFRGLRKIIYIDRSGIVYRVGKYPVIIPWRNLTIYYPPKPKQKVLKTAILGDNMEEFQIDSFTFPGFDEIINEIEKEIKKARSEKIPRHTLY